MSTKNLVLLFALVVISFGAYAQKPSFNYDKAWKRIDSILNKNGQPKTALKEVNTLYDAAKKDKNDAQLIKALVYKLNINQQLSENSDSENINNIIAERNGAKEPATSILNSVAAAYYWNYLQRNRYKFYSRTNIPDSKNNDINTSSVNQLHTKISDLYLASIANEQLLKQTRLSNYEAIIIKGNTRHLRPTLYDLLAHQALEYFKTGEGALTKPAYYFEMADSADFAPAKIFSSHFFTSTDTSSLQYQSILILQKLIAFHLNDKDPKALIDVDVERLEFVYQNSVLENKDELYQHALESIIASNAPANAALASYLLAKMYSDRAAQYDPLVDTTTRYDYNKAKEICEGVIKLTDSSEGKNNCQNLLRDILNKEISLTAEIVNIPNTPFRVLLNYRNFAKGYLKVVRSNKKGFEVRDDKYWQKLVQLPAILKKEYNLPETNDHQHHKVEIAIDPLPAGEYALIASTGPDFSLDRNTLSVQYFYVSDISYVNNGNDYYVLNRTSGAPLPSAKLQLWRRSYDNSSRSNTLKKTMSFTADKNGHVSIATFIQQQTNPNIYLDFSYGNDRLFIDNEQYHYPINNYTEVSEKETTYLFTDRSIYRPGQTIFFKGIVVDQNSTAKKPSVVTNRKSMIQLYDANYTIVDSIQLTTNEYGSYSGKFILPTGLLNGYYKIIDKNNRSESGFNVEEYKRPKFNVEINKPSGSYRLGDSIRIEGFAKGYAGNNIDGANVTFTVKRIPIRIFDVYAPTFYSYARKIAPPYGRNETEIAHGTVVTDANGKFTVVFKAIPDKSIKKSSEGSFNFQVSADVTDISGETRSGQTTVNIGYSPIRLNMNINSLMRADSLNKLYISSLNNNDIFEKIETTITINKLSTPGKIFRERLWDQPDQFILTRDEYYKLFPLDPFRDETDMTKWKSEKNVLTANYITTKDGAFKLPNKITEVGWYAIKISAKDKYNDTTTIIRFVQLYGDKINSPIAISGIDANRSVAQPGDAFDYRILTNLDSIYLIHQFYKQNKEPETRVITPLNSKKNLHYKIDVTGDAAIRTAFVKNNRIYINSYDLSVPFLNKQLRVDYITFRDKTLPGSQEKWKVKISGYQAEKVNAEILTTMYDASLDQFNPHSWTEPSIWRSGLVTGRWEANDNFNVVQSDEHNPEQPTPLVIEKIYDRLITSEQGGGRMMIRGIASESKELREVQAFDKISVPATNQGIAIDRNNTDASASSIPPQQPSGQIPVIAARKNLNETAFFFPDLTTDTAGNVEFSFITPEALTQWKWMLLAHTRDLAFGYSERTMVTQKQLMVQPNAPRFLRQGDTMQMSAKVANMTTKNIRGKAYLQLFDATTNENVDNIFGNKNASQNISIRAGESSPVFFTIHVPKKFSNPITWRITASASLQDSLKAISNITDGEEATLPVISNRMLVTESIPVPVKVGTTKTFSFDKLLKSGTSNSLQQSALTVEFTSNPAWYAVQALPYLVEGEKENAEAAFNRFYANALAATIANTSPRFKAIMEKWRTTDTAALLSNLQKNEELKSVLLQETPWVLQAKTESQQKKNIALLFEAFTLSKGLESALSKLTEMQSGSGAFTWYKDGPEDRYMTTYIVSGIGRLNKLNAIPKSAMERLNKISSSAIAYLDNEIKKDYKEIKSKKITSANVISNEAVQYLYMRSLFPNVGIPGDVFAAYNYYRNLAKGSWVKQSNYMRGLIALSLFRTGDIMNAKKIKTSLKETSINNDELGMYWKDNSGGYYWYQAPIESQVTMIETFSEIDKDEKAVNDMKIWLLKNKQTNNWNTTRSTADACYALLLNGTDWTSEQETVNIHLGDTSINSTDQKTEAGTGYFKTIIPAASIKPSMGNISVTVHPETGKPSNAGSNKDGHPAWGAIYWQYFEDLDKITPAFTPLRLNKKLFIVKNSDRGPILQPLDVNNTAKIGDKIKVRIELRADRDMEYVHMKDMRAACMEPVNVISSYKYQDALGYYQSTKDASTNFYFGSLPKGVYVFEYELMVTHAGQFSNGITSIQCMYAPEFTSHSEGINLNVQKQ